MKSFHWKYIRGHVVRFIGGSLSEINFEMFATIVKVEILCYTQKIM